MAGRAAKAVADLLTDPENDRRTAEELAELIVGALREGIEAELERRFAPRALRREAKAVSEVIRMGLDDNLSPEEVAGEATEKIRELDSQTDRVMVVGQIQEGPRPPLTVALGPFSSRGKIDSPQAFLRATAGGTAARAAAEGLAWNPSTKLGKGRFMLAPIFRSPREAWAFYSQLPVEGRPAESDLYAAAREMTAWDPEAIEPACVCGLTHQHPCPTCGQLAAHYCHKHQRGEQHSCRR
ncbi:hypothetical protein [Streptomyces sp. MP131-18]|uniref:hypothetical protein n=1 Tax=Streptomyces sp. MP131-18 TaxID=1857892 RepID=UPI0009C790A2|nr:hypothetical protein [Streptomyces sp. MP131-18]ONK10407.1 hypothetical protein STBA_11290 [Streptomyces sp. MP131-18]